MAFGPAPADERGQCQPVDSTVLGRIWVPHPGGLRGLAPQDSSPSRQGLEAQAAGTKFSTLPAELEFNRKLRFLN